MEYLSDHFLEELFKGAFYKRDVIDAMSIHLKYQYIPNELGGYKKILKSLIEYYNVNDKVPTLGLLAQNHQQDENVQEILSRVKLLKIPEKEQILRDLEEYIKRVRFQLLYSKIAELYNNGRQKEAIDLQYKESQEIANFTVLSQTNYFEQVFSGFDERYDKYRINLLQGKTNRKIPIGIDVFDAATYGGLDCELGETLCFLGRSGTGKTKFLRFVGVAAARRGYKVLHIQGEGTKEDVLDGYDATWTGISIQNLRKGEVPEKSYDIMMKSIAAIKAKSSDISVKAYEEFDSASMKDVRQVVLDYYKVCGYYPDMLIVDYLELFEPGDGRKYSGSTEGEKQKRETSARKFRNICNEFKIVGVTASQANDINPSDHNNPLWFMTRHNTSGAKGLIDSFSYFITWNVTYDEYNNNTGRLFLDKARGVKGQLLIRIATNFDHDRFYDRGRTIELFGTDLNKSRVDISQPSKSKNKNKDEHRKD